jgi:phosphomannomutase
MTVDASVFKAYDIRGVVGKQLTEDFARSLGRAFGRAAMLEGETSVAIGRDGRLSSPALATALAQGLSDVGVAVVDVGMVTTGMLYYAAATQCSSGIQVTGSHNPPDYNGFKMVLAGRAIYGDEIQALRKNMDVPIGKKQDNKQGITPGKIMVLDIAAEYQQRIISDVKSTRRIKLAIDCGNGVAGAYAASVLKAMGCEVDELFCEVDGNFPNHHPDPAEIENLEDLIHHVKTTDCEFGFAFDGDGDRLGVVTKSGEVIFPDRQLMMFAQEVLTRHPNASIIYDVKCSTLLAPYIEKAGGKPLMWKTGHSLVKAKMRDMQSPLAGEMSGHIFFKDRWYGFDDAIYCAARLIEILSRSSEPCALLEALPKAISTPEIKAHCPAGDHHAICKALQDTGVFPTAKTLNRIDGVRADYADGFGLARPSNTTPVIVLRFEGTSEAAIDRIKGEFRAALLALAPSLKLEF